MKNSGIYKFYYTLAALDVVTILVTLSIAFSIHNVYNHSFEENEVWIQRLEKYEQTTNLIIAANGPGNDIFETRDVEKERATFYDISTNLNTIINEIEKDTIDHINSDSTLLTGIKKIKENLSTGSDYSEKIFEKIDEKNLDEAGQYMSQMDTMYHLALIEISSLKKHLRTIQKEALLKDHDEANSLFKSEILVGLFVFVIIGFVVLYGRKLKEKIELSELEIKERNSVLTGYETALNEHLIVAKTDPRGIITYANRKFCEISGYLEEELIGQNQSIVNSGYHSKDFFKDMWSNILAKKKWRGLIRNKGKSGGIYWVDTTITPLLDSNGDIKEFLSIRSEVTEQMENQILISEIQDMAKVGAWELDLKTMTPKWTEGTYKIHEVPLGEEVNLEKGINFYAEHERERISELLNNCIENKVPFDDEFEFITAKGREIWVRSNGQPVIDVDGSVSKLIGTFQDVTEKKCQQLELVKAKEEAEHAEKAKADFLASMSHEIRTPMNGVLGIASLLKERLKEPENIKLIDSIQCSGDSLLNIINDILDYSKIEEGRVKIVNSIFNLKDLVTETQNLFLTVASSKGVLFEANIDESTPNWLIADASRIKQILNNLINNAIKFTHEGSVSLRISSEKNESNVILLTFRVKDSGIGIKSEDQKKLFQRFSQVDASTSRRYGGSGLGLTICKNLLELMNGTISVQSTPGLGSIFTFTIPCEISNQNDADVSQLTQSNPQTIEVNPLRILIVDDNHINLQVAKRMVEILGHSSHIVCDGFEVLKALGEQKFDVILMDCHMPGLDGHETTQKIIERYGDNRPRIIALTASVMQEDQQRCKEAGMDGFLAKPLTLANLKRELGTLANNPSKLAKGEGHISVTPENDSTVEIKSLTKEL